MDSLHGTAETGQLGFQERLDECQKNIELFVDSTEAVLIQTLTDL